MAMAASAAASCRSKCEEIIYVLDGEWEYQVEGKGAMKQGRRRLLIRAGSRPAFLGLVGRVDQARCPMPDVYRVRKALHQNWISADANLIARCGLAFVDQCPGASHSL
jgi:hypothetical protein